MISVQEIGAVLFDMDGVLVLSLAAHEEAFRHVLVQEYNITDFNYKKYAGMRTDECFRQILDQHSRTYTEKEISALTTKKQETAFEYLWKSNPVHPEAHKVLSILYEKYPLALVTSGSKRNMELFLNEYKFRKYFRCVVHGSEVSQAKPAADIYFKASAHLNVSPNNCVVVEDSLPGIYAAKSAGMTVVGVCGILEEQEIREAGAKTVIFDLAELLWILKIR